MNTVKTLLKSKQFSSVQSTSPTESVLDALQQMVTHNVGALLVMEQGKLVGILSERDYVRHVARAGTNPTNHLVRDQLVRDLMTQPVITVTSASTRAECMSLMTNKRVRHLPVVDHGQVVNVLSIGDLVKDALREQEETIHQLEQYVSG